MNVQEVLNLIEGQVVLSPENKSIIEMALYALYNQAYEEGYGEAEYLTNI